MGTAVQRAKCSVFIATSLDGFISRLDGSIDWLDKANKDITPGEDCGFREFMSTVDVMVMGRNTFEQVRTLDPWLYGTTPIIVITSRPESFNTTEERDTVSVSGDSPEAIVERLTAQGKRHVYVDGGLTIQSFLAADLIDELIITTIPVLLGAGRPLFGGGACVRDIPLAHVATRAFDFGFVQSKYRVRREGEEDST
jgi:dihydrofolate reductase